MQFGEAMALWIIKIEAIHEFFDLHKIFHTAGPLLDIK